MIVCKELKKRAQMPLFKDNGILDKIALDLNWISDKVI